MDFGSHLRCGPLQNCLVRLRRHNSYVWLVAALTIICALTGARADEQTRGFPITVSYPMTQIDARALVWSATQLGDGSLAFGVDSLVTFDGDRWKSASMGNGYALRALDFDATNNRVWAGGNGEIGWFALASGNWEFHSLKPKLPFEQQSIGEVWQVFSTPNGAVFIADSKILRWDGARFTVWSLPGGRRLSGMRSAGKIYVSHRPTGLFVIEAEGPRLLMPRSVIGDVTVFWIEDQERGLLVVTSKGIFRVEGQQRQPFAPDLTDFFTTKGTTCAARLSDGRLVVGTLHGGLVVLRADGALDRILNQGAGLPADSVMALLVDREGSLWVATPSHVTRVNILSSTEIFDQRSGLPPLPINAIARYGSGIAASSETGLLLSEPVRSPFSSAGQNVDLIRYLRSSPAGLLFARGRNIERLNDGQRAVLYHSENHDTFAVIESKHHPGSLLVSVGNSVVEVTASGVVRELVTNLPDIAFSLAEEGWGRIWIGTASQGVFVADPFSDAPTEASRADYTGVRTFDSGQVWVVDVHGGVMAVTNGAAVWFPAGKSGVRVSNFPNRPVAAVADHASGEDLWLSHNPQSKSQACVARITFDGEIPTWRAYPVDGLSQIGSPRALLVDGGESVGSKPRLWIGGDHGIVTSEVDLRRQHVHPAAPHITGLLQDDKFLDPTQPIPPLAYSTKKVTIELAALQFARKATWQLQTHVTGVDTDWIATPTPMRELTALRDGNYTLSARFVTETGEISAVSTFVFEVLPPWWRSSVAISAFVVALAVLFYAGMRWRVRILAMRTRELEAKVAQRTEQLAKASAAKTEFVANMSHDIRNPLNGIVGLSLALESANSAEHRKELIGTIQDCAKHLSSLVDDVLDFSAIEAGKVELNPEPFTPRHLLQSVAATMRLGVEQRKATLIVEPSLDLPETLVGDGSRIQQVLVNFVSNALKYGGDCIVLSAAVVADSPNEIEFAVSDDGVGIPEDDQAKLFTKFTRLRRPGTSDQIGTGLGLAACRHLADLMGGATGVKSSQGFGTRFFLRLPLVRGVQTVVTALPRRYGRVLVVEDTDYNAWAAGAVLGRLGLTYERARNGAEALEMFEKGRHSIVLLDRNLPDLDGLDVAKKIRQIEQSGRETLILAVTAFATADDRDLCLSAGMDAFVGKPLTPEKLRRALIAASPKLLSTASVQGSADDPTPNAADEIDLVLVRYLAEDEPGGLSVAIGMYLQEFENIENRLMVAVAERDWRDFHTATHRMRAHAKMVGAKRVVEICAELDSALDTSDGMPAPESLDRLRRSCARTKEAILSRAVV